MKGIFCISLDFELHWGGFEKWPIENYRTYFMNTRQVIPEMLSIFHRNEVHVTWATVGMLFHESREELIRYFPTQKPSYRQENLSAYNYMKTHPIGENENTDPLHFAPSLIRKIISTPFQELGTHTFAHFYCNEPGQTPEEFRDDLKAAQRSASLFGKTVKSMVFPRNQFNDQYLKVCFEEGITAVRSNPSDWFWKIESTQNESLWKRLNRGLDAYFPLNQPRTFKVADIVKKNGYPVSIPASRLLRPYRKKEFFLNDLKINRIISELTYAAKRGEVYHLWWHPHNFGHYPEQSLNGLEKILKHYSHCRSKWGMQSLNMGELANPVLHGA